MLPAAAAPPPPPPPPPHAPPPPLPIAPSALSISAALFPPSLPDALQEGLELVVGQLRLLARGERGADLGDGGRVLDGGSLFCLFRRCVGRLSAVSCSSGGSSSRGLALCRCRGLSATSTASSSSCSSSSGPALLLLAHPSRKQPSSKLPRADPDERHPLASERGEVGRDGQAHGAELLLRRLRSLRRRRHRSRSRFRGPMLLLELATLLRLRCRSRGGLRSRGEGGAQGQAGLDGGAALRPRPGRRLRGGPPCILASGGGRGGGREERRRVGRLRGDVEGKRGDLVFVEVDGKKHR